MHEYSLAEEVVKIAVEEAAKNNARSVSEITIEVGNMIGIESEAFESAILLLSQGTLLDKAHVKIVKIKGRGICHTCGREFEMKQRIDECPWCHIVPWEIRGGTEFRVVSLLIEEE